MFQDKNIKVQEEGPLIKTTILIHDQITISKQNWQISELILGS